MSNVDLLHGLRAVVALDGMRGCALVDLDNGMAWHSASAREDLQPVCEAASDFWRLFLRHRQDYEPALGPVRAQILVHEHGRVTQVACGPALLLVCLSSEPDRVDWARWKPLVNALRKVAASL